MLSESHQAVDARLSTPIPVGSSPIFVIPAYDEEANLPGVLAELEERTTLWRGGHMLVVDDGSADDTAGVVERWSGRLPVSVLRLGQNQGPGAAFRQGFATALQAAPSDGLIVTMEADSTSDLDALELMLSRASAGADLVLASVHGGGRMVNVSLVRRFLSRGAGAATRLALGIDAMTVSSFFRVYRAEILRRASERYGEALITEAGFACKAELLYKLDQIGASIEEVPVDLDAHRRVGASKMQLLPTMAGYWRLMRRHRILLGRSRP